RLRARPHPRLDPPQIRPLIPRAQCRLYVLPRIAPLRPLGGRGRDPGAAAPGRVRWGAGAGGAGGGGGGPVPLFRAWGLPHLTPTLSAPGGGEGGSAGAEA